MFDGEPMGFDLVALNVQRGRDHGVPGSHSIRSLFRSILIQKKLYKPDPACLIFCAPFLVDNVQTKTPSYIMIFLNNIMASGGLYFFYLHVTNLRNLDW